MVLSAHCFLLARNAAQGCFLQLQVLATWVPHLTTDHSDRGTQQEIIWGPQDYKIRLFIPLVPFLWGNLGWNSACFFLSLWAYRWWLFYYSLDSSSIPYVPLYLKPPQMTLPSKGFPIGTLTETPIKKVCGRRRNNIRKISKVSPQFERERTNNYCMTLIRSDTWPALSH